MAQSDIYSNHVFTRGQSDGVLGSTPSISLRKTATPVFELMTCFYYYVTIEFGTL